MSRSAVSASGSPYVLELHDFEHPEFDNPEKPVFSVATPAGERLDMARLEQVPPEGDIDWLWPGMIPLRKGGFLHADRVFGERTLELVAAGAGPGAACLEAEHIQQAAESGHEKNGESMGMYGESMGNGALTNAPVDAHVEQVSNLLVAPTASPASREVREESELRMAQIGTNDGQGDPVAGDDAERRDARSHAERGNEECMGIYGESMGNGSVADAPGDNHVEQDSNLLIPPTATPAIREVQEETDQ